jgi:hypothetical protein
MMEEKEYLLLKELKESVHLPQRLLAKKAGLSLGSTNLIDQTDDQYWTASAPQTQFPKSAVSSHEKRGGKIRVSRYSS